MIIIIEGIPGSGKSYLATKLIKENHFSKINWHNWPIRGSENIIEDVQTEDFTSEKYRDCSIWIDEGNSFFNSRNWKSNQRIFSWITQHRKYGQNIIFISQSYTQLDKNIKLLTQLIYTVMIIPFPVLSDYFRLLRIKDTTIKRSMYSVIPMGLYYDDYNTNFVASGRKSKFMFRKYFKYVFFSIFIFGAFLSYFAVTTMKPKFPEVQKKNLFQVYENKKIYNFTNPKILFACGFDGENYYYEGFVSKLPFYTCSDLGFLVNESGKAQDIQTSKVLSSSEIFERYRQLSNSYQETN